MSLGTHRKANDTAYTDKFTPILDCDQVDEDNCQYEQNHLTLANGSATSDAQEVQKILDTNDFINDIFGEFDRINCVQPRTPYIFIFGMLYFDRVFCFSFRAPLDTGLATFDALEPTSLQTKSSMDDETITVDTISDDSMSAMHETNDGLPAPDSTKVKLIGQNGKLRPMEKLAENHIFTGTI